MLGALNYDAIRLKGLAYRESLRLEHGFVGCEHFLLGLIVHVAAPTSKVLHKHGVILDSAVAEIHRQYSPNAPHSKGEGLQLTPRARTILPLAAVEAERLGEPTAGSPHIMLALLTEGESVAVSTLIELGVDLVALSGDVLEALGLPVTTRERYLAERAHAVQGRPFMGAI